MEHSGEYPTAIVEHMKEMGLFGMTIPEEFGGLGVDMTTFSIVFEELSRGWMGVAGVLGSHSMACFIIAKNGTPEQKAKYLPELATGARRSGLGLTEPGAGTDLQGISTTATLDGDHYIVRGSKTWITNARHADPLPVLVKTDPKAEPRHKGMSVLLIDAGTPGFTIGKDISEIVFAAPMASSIKRSAGTTLETKPALSASCASIMRAVKHMSMAFAFDTAFGKRCVPPAPGRMPNLISGCPNLALSAAMMKSHIIANSQPPPKANPDTAAITGLRMRRMVSQFLVM